MHRLHLAASLFGLMSVASTAHAVGNLADFSIYDRTSGSTLPVYNYNGQYYVAGKPGNEYRVQLRNQSGGDLLAVVSVDGVNVISGETAHWRQSGYVIDSWQSLTVDGWRKSMERTAAFYFTRLPDSYAARTDRPENVGVIGVALFQRKVQPVVEVVPAPMPYDEESRDAAPPSSARAEADAGASGALVRPKQTAQPALQNEMKKDRGDNRLGTGHGRSETSYASYTSFERASEAPAEIITIHYDSRRNLMAMGVIPDDRPLPVAANPFPGSFVPDPR
ncbi:MAG: hypothetical protein U1F34_01155 [Gammaproteobacteria bacterium]